MATPFSDVYERFLESISDSMFAKLTDTDLTEILYNYLNKSVSLEFRQCKKDLQNIDKTLEQFNEDLTDEEQWIIALGMVLAYLSTKKYKEELMRQSLGDRDYKASSPQDLLRVLLELEKDTRNQLKSYIRKYTYTGFEGLS